MLTSIIGLMVSILFVMKISKTWGFTFVIFFTIMFISSIISMSNLDHQDKEALEHLAIHETRKKHRR